MSLSPIVAGAWRLADWTWNAAERLAWIEGCLDLGVTSFDHADIYGGYRVEELFGEALALSPSVRQRLQLVTKCGIRLCHPARSAHRIKHYDTSAPHIIASAEESLRLLGTDYLDVLLLHRPDPLMDADEVARAFDELRTSGKVRYFGVSNFSPAQYDVLQSRTPLVTNQIEWHPLHRAPLTDGTLDHCQRRRIRPMIWSPLAGGTLFTGEEAAARRVRGMLQQIAIARGVSAATIAFAWLLRHPSRPIPIAGSGRLEAMREAVAATTIRLDAQEWTEIYTAGTGRDVP
ncbi:aldo/keto reductase family oxidoreductase [Gemmatimonas sp.]|uniref:aldo/keto reductase n=1 Tax=Gemmatimonas sp. TaxID=1962908 RepID=UPI003982ED9C